MGTVIAEDFGSIQLRMSSGKFNACLEFYVIGMIGRGLGNGDGIMVDVV